MGAVKFEGGFILGDFYALVAVGLGLQYGVARILNVSHGEFIMLGAFGTYSLHMLLGIKPIIALMITAPIIFALAFLIHKVFFMRLWRMGESAGKFEGNSLLVSFGLMFIIQNRAVLSWGPDIKGYTYLVGTVDLYGAVYAKNRLVALLFAVVIGLGFYYFVAKTRLGKAIRAAAQDGNRGPMACVHGPYHGLLCDARHRSLDPCLHPDGWKIKIRVGPAQYR